MHTHIFLLHTNTTGEIHYMAKYMRLVCEPLTLLCRESDGDPVFFLAVRVLSRPDLASTGLGLHVAADGSQVPCVHLLLPLAEIPIILEHTILDAHPLNAAHARNDDARKDEHGSSELIAGRRLLLPYLLQLFEYSIQVVSIHCGLKDLFGYGYDNAAAFLGKPATRFPEEVCSDELAVLVDELGRRLLDLTGIHLDR